MIYTSIHFYIIKSILHYKLQYNYHRENYKLTELGAKLEELMLNHEDSNGNNLKRKHGELTN